MVDMTKLLQHDTSQAKPPVNAPNGVGYKGVVANWRTGSRKFNDKNTGGEIERGIISIELRATAYPDNIAPPEEGIPLEKRKFSADFMLDPEDIDTYFQLNKFLKSCGIRTEGRQLQETLPECVGQEVQFNLVGRNYTDKATGEVKEAQDIRGLSGLASSH